MFVFVGGDTSRVTAAHRAEQISHIDILLCTRNGIALQAIVTRDVSHPSGVSAWGGGAWGWRRVFVGGDTSRVTAAHRAEQISYIDILLCYAQRNRLAVDSDAKRVTSQWSARGLAACGVFSRYAWTAIRLYAMFVFVGGDTSRVTAAHRAEQIS